VGVYAGGSVGLGGFDRRRSDLDVAIVVDGSLDARHKDALVAALRHEAFACPARGLELVVYRREAAVSNDVAAGFELNLNSGRGLRWRLDAAPDVADLHWFAIDRSILRQHGLAIVGPPAREVFGDISRDRLLPLVAAAVRWHLDGAAATGDAILNACRALRFGIEGVWSSKVDAGRWALRHVPGPSVVAAALDARSGAPSPPRGEANELVRFVLDELERAH
jgi:hypothetical protein